MRRILITGFAPDSGNLSPARSKSKRKGFEIWSFNNDTDLAKVATAHFEMHDLDVYGKKSLGDAVPSPDYLDALHKGLGPKVYMLKADPTIPGSVAYPIKEIRKHFQTDYFTNSISYMLALAIYEKVDEIHLYGIDMALQHESAWERPSIEYFLGIAWGRGIKVVIPKESDLLKCLGLYGFEPIYEYEVNGISRRAQSCGAFKVQFHSFNTITTPEGCKGHSTNELQKGNRHLPRIAREIGPKIATTLRKTEFS